MPDARSVAVGYWVDVGSRDERGAVAGATHFLEHLLFKGTRRRSALQIAESLDAVGGDMNAFTSKEYTCFYARCLDRDLPLAVDVLGDMITSATLRSPDVASERDVVLEEIRMHLDTPDDLVHSEWSQAFFGEHPLGREVLGDTETIAAMSRDSIARWYRRRYVPEHLVVAAAGNLEHDRLVELVSASLEGLDRSGTPRATRSAPQLVREARAVVRRRPTEQAHVVLGGEGLARADERRFAASVLNQALGGGMSSRLFQEVRERRGLVYTVYSYHGSHQDTGTFAVYAGTGPKRIAEVLDVVRGELDRFRSDGLDEAELARAKGYLAGSTVLGLEDSGSRMTRIGKSAVTGVPLLTVDEVLARIDAVTLDDVAAVGEALLGGPWTLAVVGPVDARQRRSFERALAA